MKFREEKIKKRKLRNSCVYFYIIYPKSTHNFKTHPQKKVRISNIVNVSNRFIQQLFTQIKFFLFDLFKQFFLSILFEKINWLNKKRMFFRMDMNLILQTAWKWVKFEIYYQFRIWNAWKNRLKINLVGNYRFPKTVLLLYRMQCVRFHLLKWKIEAWKAQASHVFVVDCSKRFNCWK